MKGIIDASVYQEINLHSIAGHWPIVSGSTQSPHVRHIIGVGANHAEIKTGDVSDSQLLTSPALLLLSWTCQL